MWQGYMMKNSKSLFKYYCESNQVMIQPLIELQNKTVKLIRPIQHNISLEEFFKHLKHLMTSQISYSISR